MIGHSAKLNRFFVTEHLERRAYELLERYSDHAFSFTDATSFALMREHRIGHAFAFDAHFSIAGFVTIPGDLPVQA